MSNMSAFIRLAVEASYYVSPRDAGLTRDEIAEICTRHDYKNGQIVDTIDELSGYNGLLTVKKDRLYLSSQLVSGSLFSSTNVPSFRNEEAFDFIHDTLNGRIIDWGRERAQVQRDELVALAMRQQIPEIDIEAAYELTSTLAYFAEKDGYLSYRDKTAKKSPSQQQSQKPTYHPASQMVLETVRDIIARRTNSLPKYADPLKAFADMLAPLKYGHFRIWWSNIVSELRICNSAISPRSKTVLAAAIVEAVLTFCVKYGQSLTPPFLGSNTLQGSADKWKINDLISGAAYGSPSIIDNATKNRAEALISARNQIHAGNLIAAFPTGNLPDLRPEQADEGEATAKKVVRDVLNWLEKHPPT